MLLGLDASEWTAVGTVATAVVAVVAAAFAFAQVREARRTREDQVRPFVVVDLQPSRAWGNALNLVVENIGRTVARDVRLTFEPPLKTTMDDKYPIGESTLVREGVAMMPPGRRIEALFDVSHERDKTDLPMRYDVTVELHDARGRPQEPQRYIIDLAPLYGLTRITEYGMHDAAKALREMQKSMKKWSDIHGRLKVWVRDEDRDNLDDRAHEFLTGRWPTMASRRPPEVLVVLARSPVVRAMVAAIGPLHRWLQRSLGGTS